MTERTYETRFLSTEERQALRKLHQRLMTGGSRSRHASLLYAWASNYHYNGRSRDGIMWLGRFQATLAHVIDTCKAHGLRNPDIFEALVTGDVETLEHFFKGICLPEDHGLMLFPGIRAGFPKQGISLAGHTERSRSKISEQIFFVFDPLLDLALDDFNPNMKLPKRF